MKSPSFRIRNRNRSFKALLKLPRQEEIELGFTTRRYRPIVKRSRDLKSIRPLKLSACEKAAYPIQIHSGRLSIVTKRRMSGKRALWNEMGLCDGVLTSLNNWRLVIVSADCLPIFLMAPSNPPWIGLIHAGWRGSRKRIARRAVEKLHRVSGVSPGCFRAVLGPALRSCCYEVGPEFKRFFPRSTFVVKSRRHFDLVGENRMQLEQSGLRAAQIMDTGLCTSCRSDLFYSYRCEKHKAGRMLSWMKIRPV